MKFHRLRRISEKLSHLMYVYNTQSAHTKAKVFSHVVSTQGLTFSTDRGHLFSANSVHGNLKCNSRLSD